MIVSNQVRYSLVDRTIEDDLLPFCESKQITVLAFSPLDHGIQNLRRFDPEDVLGQVARETGKTRAQVALNWCLCREQVIVHLWCWQRRARARKLRCYGLAAGTAPSGSAKSGGLPPSSANRTRCSKSGAARFAEIWAQYLRIRMTRLLPLVFE